MLFGSAVLFFWKDGSNYADITLFASTLLVKFLNHIYQSLDYFI